MSETKWTPGPWKVGGDMILTHYIMADDGKHIALLGTVKSLEDTGGQMRFNAELIAAAPELYEALWGLFAGIHVDQESGGLCVKCDMTEYEYEALDRLLAKARGEHDQQD